MTVHTFDILTGFLMLVSGLMTAFSFSYIAFGKADNESRAALGRIMIALLGILVVGTFYYVRVVGLVAQLKAATAVY